MPTLLTICNCLGTRLTINQTTSDDFRKCIHALATISYCIDHCMVEILILAICEAKTRRTLFELFTYKHTDKTSS